MGYTGFTLVMPFLPLFIRQLGVTDVGEIALWTGLCLGVTPGVTAVLSRLVGPARRSARAQDHGRALARELRHNDSRDGVCHARVTRAGAARGARAVRRLRLDLDR